MEILKVEHLVKQYGKGDNAVLAVNDISFSVEQGEFVAIVGSSGSGKSTLLHLLGGVDRPTSGKVYIQGEDIWAGTTSGKPGRTDAKTLPKHDKSTGRSLPCP